VWTLSGYVGSLEFDGAGTGDRALLTLAKLLHFDSPVLTLALGLVGGAAVASDGSSNAAEGSLAQEPAAGVGAAPAGGRERPPSLLAAAGAAISNSPFALQPAVMVAMGRRVTQTPLSIFRQCFSIKITLSGV
jgi:hypothetical protein